MSFGATGLQGLRQPRVLDDTYGPEGLWIFDGNLLSAGSVADDFAVDSGTLQYSLSHEHGKQAARLKDNQVRLMGTTPTPLGLRITGDVTVQVVFMMDTTVGTDSFGTVLFFGASTQGGTGGETNNDLYGLQLGDVSSQMTPRFTWEYGAGLREALLASNDLLTLGQWYHLVGVRESNGGGMCTGRMYLNGQLIAEDTNMNEATGGTGGSNRNWIGRDPNGAGLGWLGGIISSAKVNSRALTAKEVKYEWQHVSGEQPIRIGS